MFECGICAYLLDDLEVDANLMASLKALVALVKKIGSRQLWIKTMQASAWTFRGLLHRPSILGRDRRQHTGNHSTFGYLLNGRHPQVLHSSSQQTWYWSQDVWWQGTWPDSLVAPLSFTLIQAQTKPEAVHTEAYHAMWRDFAHLFSCD